jgi:hypothetical protein
METEGSLLQSQVSPPVPIRNLMTRLAVVTGTHLSRLETITSHFKLGQ